LDTASRPGTRRRRRSCWSCSSPCSAPVGRRGGCWSSQASCWWRPSGRRGCWRPRTTPPTCSAAPCSGSWSRRQWHRSSPAQRTAGRATTSRLRAALDTIDAERAALTSHAQLLHPSAAKVLATLDREWDGLARHREYPELPLDNNTAERALRGPVVGRKNYYGSGSVVSAQLASHVFTITATAQRAGLNPLAYLRAYLHECARAGATAPTGEALTRFLPWAAGTNDLTAWTNSPRSQPDTPEPDTPDNNARSTDKPRTGPAP